MERQQREVQSLCGLRGWRGEGCWFLFDWFWFGLFLLYLFVIAAVFSIHLMLPKLFACMHS